MTSSPSQTEKILYKLVKAKNEIEVERILQDSFFDSILWKPLGGTENNYATVTNQQSDPVNALCEKPINSIDAYLLKKCKLAGDDPESGKAPQSMNKALEKYLKIPGGEFMNLPQEQIKELAKNIRIIADGAKTQPNIIIADRGEGQKPEDFEDTLLSLQKGNKKKIKFVQGKYNMGGTGVLPFCGTKGYQLILARKSVELEGDSSEWGFTLVREKPDVSDAYKTTWYEYFTDSEEKICHISGKPLKILPKNEELLDGCFIKLYNYELPHPSVITNGLWADLNIKLFSPAIPISMFENRTDFDMAIDNDLRFRILYGNKNRIQRDAKKYVNRNFSVHSRLRNFGTNKIDVTVFKHASMIRTKQNKTKEFRKESEAILLTQNGQTHATLSQTMFKSQTKLTSLANYIMLHVDLTNIPPNKAKMFLASRDRARKSNDYKELVKRIFKDVSDDDQLKALNEEYKKLDDKNSVKDATMEEVISKILRKNKPFMELLDPGKLQIDDKPKIALKKEFISSYIPTFLKVRGAEETITHQMQIPYNGDPTYIHFKTDAPDDYTIRDLDRGELIVESPDILEQTYYGPYDGFIKVKLWGIGTKGGTIGDLKVTLTRPEMEPLQCTIRLHFDEPKKGSSTRGPRKEKDTGISMPTFKWITRDEWGIWSWDEFTVASADSENIRINKNCKYLEEFKRNRPSVDGSKITAQFGLNIYLTSLMLYFEMKDEESYESMFKKAISAVAKSCLPIAYDFNEESIEKITKMDMNNVISEAI